MKQCTGCQETLPLSSFTRDKSKADGLRTRCKACSGAAKRAAYVNNREAVIARTRAYYAQNRDAMTAAMRRNRQDNLEDRRAYDRQRYADKGPRQKTPRRREVWKASNAKYRARRRGQLGERPPTAQDVRDWIQLYDLWGCSWCHTSHRSMNLDHIVPLIRGGLHTVENLQPLCSLCNNKKYHRTMEEFAQYMEAL